MDYRLLVFSSLFFIAVDMMDGIALIIQETFSPTFNDGSCFHFVVIYSARSLESGERLTSPESAALPLMCL